MTTLLNNQKIKLILSGTVSFLEAYSIIYLLGINGLYSAFCLFLLPAFYLLERRINSYFKLRYRFIFFAIIFGGCLFYGRIYFSDTVGLRFYTPALYLFFSKLIYNCCVFIESALDKFTSEIENNKKGALKFFALCWGVIFIAWLPYLLGSLPGVLTYDSIKQMNMALGNIQITDHHPILHTMLIKICLKIGGGSPIGYSVLQMLCLSAVFAFTVTYIRSRGTKYRFTLLLITMWFALNPIHAVYSINMQKDTLFGGAVLLLTVVLYQTVITKGECLKKAKWLAFFIISVLLVCFLRNNGPYVLIILLPILFFALKKQRKQIILTSLIFIVSLFLVKTVVFNTADVEKGSFAESVGVPLQQIARVIYDGNELSEDEKNTLEKFISIENIKENYDPKCVDPLKSELYNGGLDHKALNENKGEFLGLWYKLLVKHPKTYICAYLDETSGYWYPFDDVPYISLWGYTVENNLGIKTDTVSSALTSVIENVISLCYNQRIPIISILFSMGAMIFSVLYFGLYSIKNGNYKKLIPFLPVLILWLSVLITAPISNHLRYLYPTFTCIPLLIQFSLKNLHKQK